MAKGDPKMLHWAVVDIEEEAKAPFLIYFCTYINVALLLVDLKRFTVRQ